MELAGCLPKMLRTVSCDARVYRGLRLPQYDCRLRRRKRYVQQIRYNAVQVCGAGVTDMVAEGRSSPRMNVAACASPRVFEHAGPAALVSRDKQNCDATGENQDRDAPAPGERVQETERQRTRRRDHVAQSLREPGQAG